MKKTIKNISISILMLLSTACLANEIVLFEGDRKIKLGNHYRVTTCKNIGFANCTNCMDTPNYYFNIETKQLISSCGGACWHPRGKQREICKTLCPPPKWECKNDS